MEGVSGAILEGQEWARWRGSLGLPAGRLQNRCA